MTGRNLDQDALPPSRKRWMVNPGHGRCAGILPFSINQSNFPDEDAFLQDRRPNEG
jgi:hypothetical protein